MEGDVNTTMRNLAENLLSEPGASEAMAKFSYNSDNLEIMKKDYWHTWSIGQHTTKQGKFTETQNAMWEKYGKRLRLRYVPDNYLHCAFFEFDYCINLYLMLVDEEIEEFVRGVVIEYRLHQVSSQQSFIECGKRLSTIYKKGGSALSEHWKYIVDIHTLSGVVSQSDEEFEVKIAKWVGTGVELPAVKGSHSMYVAWMESNLAHWWESVQVRPTLEYSFKHLIETPELWVTGGVSTNFKATDSVVSISKGMLNEIGVSNSKAILSIYGNSEAMYTSYKTQRPFVAYAAQKEELGKPREIVTGNDQSYFLMHYIFRPIYKVMEKNDNKFCTVYMNEEEVMNVSTETSAWLTKGYIAPPADADMFDKHQSKELILMVIRFTTGWFISQYLQTHGEDELIKEYCECVDLLTYGMENGTVMVNGNSYKWENGVLSGWYITIWIDSMISYLYGAGAMNVMQEVMGRKREESLIAQGDDLLPRIVNTKRVVVWLRILTEILGIKFNPSKFWIEGGRSEFLRKIIYTQSVDAYPIRPVSKMVFQKDKEAGDENVVIETIKKYDVMASRGCDMERVKKMMLFEVRKFEGMAEFSEKVVESCIAYGGYGTEIASTYGKQVVLAEKIVGAEDNVGKGEIRKGSPAYMEKEKSKKMGVEKQVTEALEAQLKPRRRKARVHSILRTVNYELMGDMGGVESTAGLGEKFIAEGLPEKEIVVTNGPNIAAAVALKESRNKPIHSKIINNCGYETLNIITKFASAGMTYFGGPVEPCLKRQHRYILDRIVKTALRHKRCKYQTEIKNVIAKALLIMQKDIKNVYFIAK